MASAADVVQRAIKFGAPEKVITWATLGVGGKRNRVNQVALQPSGNVGKEKKRQGRLLAGGAKRMKR